MDEELMENFMEEQRAQENNKKIKAGGWNEKYQKWYPHASAEGGTKTICYGIKLRKGGPEYKTGLTKG